MEQLAARLGRTPEELAADLICAGLEKLNDRNVTNVEIDRVIEEDYELLKRSRTADTLAPFLGPHRSSHGLLTSSS